jgi:hypothetical protein
MPTKAKFTPRHFIYAVAPALWQHPSLDLNARGVATVLLMHRNAENGGCFPEYETIALEVGLSKSSRHTVKEALQELKEAGLIDWVRHGRANRYDLSGLLALCDQKLLSAAEVEKAVEAAKADPRHTKVKAPKSLPRAA